jgi:hypothetical protein
MADNAGAAAALILTINTSSAGRSFKRKILRQSRCLPRFIIILGTLHQNLKSVESAAQGIVIPLPLVKDPWLLTI